MLHERTASLVHLDAIAVRDQSDTLVWYADRLTTEQRAALRRYLLEVLADKEGPVATVAVAAGATELVLAGTKARTQGLVPLSLTGTVMFTLAAALLTAVFVAAVVVLIADAQRGQNGQPQRAAAGAPTAPREPLTMPQPPAGGLVSQPEEPPTREEQTLRTPSLPVDLPGRAQHVAPPTAPPPGSVVPPRFSPGAPAGPLGATPSAPGATAAPRPPSPLQEPPAAVEDVNQPDVDLPDVGLPNVDLPNVQIPDGGVSVDLPEVELPDVELPDVDLAGVDLSLPDVDVDIPDVDVPDVEVSDDESSEDDSSGESESDEEDGGQEGAEAGDSDE
jgi:hypothetical protein